MADTTAIAVSVEVGAAMIDCSPTTLRGYIEQGLIPAVRLPSAKRPGRSRRVMVAVADLETFVQQHTVKETVR